MPFRPSQVEKLRNQIAMPTIVAVDLDDVAEDRGVGPEQDLVELVLGGLDGVGLPLVLGQLADEPEHRRDVRWGGGPDHDRRP